MKDESAIDPKEPMSEAEFDAMFEDPLFRERMKRAMLNEAARGPGPLQMPGNAPPRQRPQSNVEAFMAEVRAAHTDEEIEAVVVFLERVFEPLIEEHPKTQSKSIKVAAITASKNTRRLGLTDAPDDFTIHRAIPLMVVAMYYIDIIIENEGKSDEEVVWAMIDYSKNRDGMELHPEWNFIIGKDESGERKLELWTHEPK